MSAEGVDRPLGRTKDELERAALNVRVKSAIREYRNKRGFPNEFSYSLETGKFYEANKLEDRAALLEHYGDGHSPVYVVAVTNTRGFINDEFAVRSAEECVQQGRIPFIGRWVQNGELHEDVSIMLNHGVPTNSVKDMLIGYGQAAGLIIERETATLLYINNEQA